MYCCIEDRTEQGAMCRKFVACSLLQATVESETTTTPEKKIKSHGLGTAVAAANRKKIKSGRVVLVAGCEQVAARVYTGQVVRLWAAVLYDAATGAALDRLPSVGCGGGSV